MCQDRRINEPVIELPSSPADELIDAVGEVPPGEIERAAVAPADGSPNRVTARTITVGADGVEAMEQSA